MSLGTRKTKTEGSGNVLRRRRTILAWGFALPFVVVFCVFMLIPLLSSMAMSFTDITSKDLRTPFNVNFVGLDQYIALFHDRRFLHALGVTGIFVLVGLPITMVIALAFAVALNKGSKHLNAFFRAVFYAPVVASVVAVSVVWRYILQKDGLLNSLLAVFGIAGPDGLSRKEALQDLLLFYSSTEKKLVTLREYVDRMPESQKYIYYAAGENVSAIDHLPQTELLKDKNYEILYLTGETDEFVLQMLGKYADKEFRSIVDGELDLGDEEEKVLDEKPELMQFVKETLGDKIKEARASRRLKTHPVCMTAGEGLSFEMEKYFKNFQMPTPVKADRILELNTDHPAVQAMEAAMTSDRAKAELYAKILYDQALLIAGLPLEDPSEYTDLVAELMK